MKIVSYILTTFILVAVLVYAIWESPISARFKLNWGHRTGDDVLLLQGLEKLNRRGEAESSTELEIVSERLGVARRQRSEALRLVNLLIARDAREPRYFIARARIFEDQGDKAQAIADLLTARKILDSNSMSDPSALMPSESFIDELISELEKK